MITVPKTTIKILIAMRMIWQTMNEAKWKKENVKIKQKKEQKERKKEEK